MQLKKKTVIGWTEYVDFPDWGIRGLRAKVDTGARTSALHVEDILALPGGRICFHVILSSKRRDRRVAVHARPVKWAKVRSSTGDYSTRCFVRTRVRIGDVEKEIDVSLVSRDKMRFRMLLGRKAVEKDFLVDVTKRTVLRKKSRKRKKGQAP